MKVISLSFGYCKVELQNEQASYVTSEDIKPASVELVARVLTSATTVDRDPAITGEHFRLSGDPRLIAPPEPLPESQRHARVWLLNCRQRVATVLDFGPNDFAPNFV
ncbi:MAG: hypothetical protein ABJB32_01410 [Verrucomicrobiota bacterium]